MRHRLGHRRNGCSRRALKNHQRPLSRTFPGESANTEGHQPPCAWLFCSPSGALRLRAFCAHRAGHPHGLRGEKLDRPLCNGNGFRACCVRQPTAGVSSYWSVDSCGQKNSATAESTSRRTSPPGSLWRAARPRLAQAAAESRLWRIAKLRLSRDRPQRLAALLAGMHNIQFAQRGPQLCRPVQFQPPNLKPATLSGFPAAAVSAAGAAIEGDGLGGKNGNAERNVKQKQDESAHDKPPMTFREFIFNRL